MTAMTATSGTPGENLATRKEWIGLAVLALPCLLLSLDMSVLYLALPELSADLQPSATQTLWILDIYGFMIAGFLVTMGTLGDRIGRRRLLMIGGAAFGVASVLAAYATTPEMLIASRAILGIAGATLMPSTLALISNMFRDARQRGMAIAVWMSSFMLGIAVGPLIGGALLEAFWWGSAFLLGVPVMILLLVTAPILLPEFRDARAGRLDLISVAMLLAAILPIVYAIKEVAVAGLTVVPLVMLAVGLAWGWLFVRRQRTLADPLIDLGLFANRTFRAALGIMVITTVFVAGVNLVVSQYLQLVEGLSPLRAGLWLIPSAVAMVVSTIAGTQLAHRVGPGLVLAGGSVVAMAGCLVLTQAETSGSLAVVVAGFGLISFGLGPIGSLCTELVVGSATPERAGAASAMSETSAELGFALGVTIFGSVAAAVYRGQLADTVAPEIPATATDAARENLAGATVAAAELPAPLGASLLTAARDAFMSGLTTLAVIGTIAFVALAVFAFVALRHDRPSVWASATDGGEVADTAVPDGRRTPSSQDGTDQASRSPVAPSPAQTG